MKEDSLGVDFLGGLMHRLGESGLTDCPAPAGASQRSLSSYFLLVAFITMTTVRSGGLAQSALKLTAQAPWLLGTGVFDARVLCACRRNCTSDHCHPHSMSQKDLGR